MISKEINISDRLGISIELAREAGNVLLSYFGTDRVDARQKGERDVVTAADLASESLIVERLAIEFREEGILAEEGARASAAGGLTWIIDPLDGTLNFSRGIPIWCVSIALFEDDKPILGVIYDPVRDEMFWAACGHGALCNGTPIRCTSLRSLSDLVVQMTIDFHDNSMIVGLEDIQVVAPRVLRTRNIGSVAVALAYLGAGRLDAVIHRYANAWDYGAGVVIVQEAGGTVTDDSGGQYTAATKGLLAATSKPAHDGLLEILRNVTSSQVE